MDRAFTVAAGPAAVWPWIIQLGKNLEVVSRARIEIEAMRLMVLKAAKAMDVLGNREARVWVHMVKALVPERVCKIIDEAIQMHGATGVSQWTPLAQMYTSQRTLRIADGPDEVHHMVVGRAELARPAARAPRAEQIGGPGNLAECCMLLRTMKITSNPPGS